MRVGWKLPLERLSATSLATAIQCPEMFRQKYLLHTEEKNFGARFVGSVDHEVAKVLALDRLYKREPSDIDELHATAWNGVLEADGEPDWRDDDPVKMAEISRQMAHLYWEEVLVTAPIVAVEERIEFRIAGLPSKIVGYADMIEPTKIRERKTTASKQTKPKSKWLLQGLIYQRATGLPVQWDVVTRQATPKLYLADEHEDLYLPYRDGKYVDQMILDTAKRINDLYAQYGADQAWPTSGLMSDWLCSYCAIGPRYARSCPAWVLS